MYTIKKIWRDIMIYCKHCGKEISEDSIYCQHCGSKIEVYIESDKPLQKSENRAWGILSIIFSSLMGSGLGLIFAIVGLCVYKKKSNRICSWVGLGIYLAWTVASIIISALIFYNVILWPVPYWPI